MEEQPEDVVARHAALVFAHAVDCGEANLPIIKGVEVVEEGGVVVEGDCDWVSDAEAVCIVRLQNLPSFPPRLEIASVPSQTLQPGLDM